MSGNNLIAKDLHGVSYYSTPTGSTVSRSASSEQTLADIYKGVTCANGINTFTWNTTIDNDTISTSHEQLCNTIADSPVNNIETKNINSTLLSDLEINCGDYPITYINVDNGVLQYSCGTTPTNDVQHSQNVPITLNTTIDCGSNVLTQLYHTDINGPTVSYICKEPTAASNVSNIIQQSEIFNTTAPNYIQNLNIKTNSFNHPTHFWSKHDYTSTIPVSTTYYVTDTTINDDFFSVTCGDRGISGMTYNNGAIKYGCGNDKLYDLYVQEYELNRDPTLSSYYNSGAMFDKVKCKNDEVLSSFHRTMTPKGPKIQWVCGKLAH